MSETDDLEKYRSGASGVDSKFANISSGEHVLKQKFGDDKDEKAFVYDAEVAGQRFVDFYDDVGASIREYLSNAETACIRRARAELRNGGFDVPDSPSDVMSMAREKCDYEPLIEVTWNKSAESTRLTIEDNGIGISPEEFQVLRRIGYSASHTDGENLGQFGLGFMSGFLLVGHEGAFRMYTHSYPNLANERPEESYSLACYITNFEYLDGLREAYGTRFEFPSFCEKAQGIDIRGKVAEFAEGMRVPVLYREMDRDGRETYNEDYTPTELVADYSDDALVIEYENEFFEAVMSPGTPERRGYVTYNISMPIRRNTEQYGTEPKFNAAWTWDFRGKSENGPIVASNDDSVVGLAPVSDAKYESLPEERKDSFIRRSEVPDDAIVMPTPASSRDSYEGGYDGFWRYVSTCLQSEWENEVAERLGALDDFDDFTDLGTREKRVIIRGYQRLGPGYGKNDPDNIVEHFEDELDVTIPKSVAEKLDRLTESERVVIRGTDTPQYKKSTSKQKVWQIIDDTSGSGTVYIGKTISPKKAEIAWALDNDNVVVRVEPEDDESTKECYERLQEMWGWELLKDLPSRNLKEKLPDLPDDVAEKYETTSSKDMKKNSSSSDRRTSRNPETKNIRVYGSTTRSRRGMSLQSAKDVYDELDNDGSVKGRYYTVRQLIIYYEGDTNIGEVKNHTQHDGVGVATVPKYVYNYLKDADNIYTSVSGLAMEQANNATIDFNGTEENLVDLDASDLLVVSTGKLRQSFRDRKDVLLEEIESILDEDFDRLTFVGKGDLAKYWAVQTDATVVSTKRQRGIDYTRLRDEDGKRVDADDILKRVDGKKNVDWDHPVMKAINGYGRVRDDVEREIRITTYLEENDCLPTVDDS